MKKNRWSEHEKYIVMLTSHNSTARGVRLGYQAYLDFKRVKEALIAMSKNDGNYSYDGNIYNRVITSSRASQILMKIEDCRWDEDIRTVAKQIKAGDMLSPARHGNLKALYELPDTEKLSPSR